MDEKNLYPLSDNDHVHAMLHEDTESNSSADDLLPVVTRLKAWESPVPDAAATRNLLDLLERELPMAVDSPAVFSMHRWYEWWPLLLIRSQVRVVRREIWAASALMLLLGTLVTLTSYEPSAGGATPIAILAPVVAALGVALLYDSDIEQMLELEDSTPASVRLLVLARLTLVFGFDLLLALAGSVLLVLAHADVLLWPLVMSWLAPMTFLSALAFLLSIFTGDAITGSLAGLMIWGIHVLMRTVSDASWLSYVLSLPGLSDVETRPLLFAFAPLLVCLGLWWMGYRDRQIGDLN